MTEEVKTVEDGPVIGSPGWGIFFPATGRLDWYGDDEVQARTDLDWWRTEADYDPDAKGVKLVRGLIEYVDVEGDEL